MVVGLGVGVALVAALPKRAHRRIVVSMVVSLVVSISVGRFVVEIGGLESWVRARKVVFGWCLRWVGVVGVGGWSE